MPKWCSNIWNHCLKSFKKRNNEQEYPRCFSCLLIFPLRVPWRTARFRDLRWSPSDPCHMQLPGISRYLNLITWLSCGFFVGWILKKRQAKDLWPTVDNVPCADTAADLYAHIYPEKLHCVNSIRNNICNMWHQTAHTQTYEMIIYSRTTHLCRTDTLTYKNWERKSHLQNHSKNRCHQASFWVEKRAVPDSSRAHETAGFSISRCLSVGSILSGTSFDEDESMEWFLARSWPVVFLICFHIELEIDWILNCHEKWSYNVLYLLSCSLLSYH